MKDLIWLALKNPKLSVYGTRWEMEGVEVGCGVVNCVKVGLCIEAIRTSCPSYSIELCPAFLNPRSGAQEDR